MKVSYLIHSFNKGTKVCIEIDKKVNQVIITKGATDKKAFTYDAVYDSQSDQRLVYDESAFPLVESVLEGYNGTIFAYGQTGCGKTHTMMGLKDAGPEHRGIIPNAFEHIFGFIDSCPNSSTMKFLVRCSYLEIYNEDIRDLLTNMKVGQGQSQDQKLELKEDPNKGGVYVKDLTCCIVKSIPEIEKLMFYGTSQRKTGETAMNKDSSRSHSIFTIYIETSEQDATGESRIKAGKLNLVDLAGSERQSKTQAQGIRLKEATKINLSLSALGNVISALVDGKSSHIPYRDSKLTRLLQDSLGGNTKTVMIAAISPSDFNYEETLSTLRYAARAKSIQNKPRVNEDPKEALLKQYEEEIKKLKMLLDQNNGAAANQMISVQKKPLEKALSITEEESVDQLLEKLAKKGKKVKIINEEGGATEENNESNQQPERRKSTRKTKRQTIKERDNLAEGSIAEVENEDEDLVVSSSGAGPGETQTHMKGRPNNKRTIIRESQDSSQLQKPQQPVDLHQALNDAELSKDQLANLIKEMEQRLVIGGSNSNVVENQEDKDRIRKQRALQIKLRKEKKKQKDLLEQKQKQEEELLLKNQQYSSLQEETEQNRNIIEKLRSKYKQVASELRDVREQAEEEKQDVLETVREQEKEIEFLNIIVKALMREYELQNLRDKSRYDENNQKWVVPVFYVKDKALQLPKVGIRNAEGLIQSELDKRDLIIQQESMSNCSDDFEGDTRQNGFNQKSSRMDETYYNNNGPMKTGQGFQRGNGADKMRQSRMSVGYDQSSIGPSGDRVTPIEMVRNANNNGARTGHSIGKFKQAPNARLYSDHSMIPTEHYSMVPNQLQTMLNSESEMSLNKKNMKSNMHLQPLNNYKTGQPLSQVPNVAQGIEDILKNHQMNAYGNQSSDMTQVYGNMPQKKSQLGKLSQLNNNGPSIHLNLNPSDSSATMNGQNSSFQMSIQATVSIEQTNNQQYAPRRPQLAPLNSQSPPQMNGVKGSFIEAPQARIQGPNNGQGNSIRKNRVVLQSVNQQFQ